jgi:hypothetical protein
LSRHEEIWSRAGIAPILLTSALDGGEWSASRPYRFTPGTHSIGDWVDPGIGLNAVEKRKALHRPAQNPAVHPVARRYIDWAIQAPTQINTDASDLFNYVENSNINRRGAQDIGRDFIILFNICVKHFIRPDGHLGSYADMSTESHEGPSRQMPFTVVQF